ncbi:MAG: mechanosensitive ion channel family protein [Hyphomonas sp.]|uniref:mechanosensitive ion channel family protein n=1 Tax=Hyphomonas sp. TaxID=87 RepID=UPI00349FDB01
MTEFTIPMPAALLLGLDTSTWPAWLATIWPNLVKWGLVLVSVALIWLVSSLLRWVILFIGKRMTPKDQEFTSTSWDLAASTARFFAFILMMPLPLGVAGYDWRSLVNERGPGAIGAVMILVIAFVVANAVSRSLRRFGAQAQAHSGADDTLIAFSASLIKYIIFAIAIVFALSQLGFPAASLAAVLGAAGLAIGLALQDTLKSVAAGVMLAIFRPFRIGDFVTLAGLDGTVTDITPFTTSMRQIDNKIVSITNDKVWGSPLVNHTREPRRRLDLFFTVSYDDDLDKALEVMITTADAHPAVLKHLGTWAGVHNLADWSIELRLRAWVATPDFVQVKADLIKVIKQAFDAQGITIPFPTQVEYAYEGKQKPPPKAPDFSQHGTVRGYPTSDDE